MSVDQVVPGQIQRGVMHRVDEVGLHHGVVGLLHRISCVDYINLERIQTQSFTKSCRQISIRDVARAKLMLFGTLAVHEVEEVFSIHSTCISSFTIM